MKLRFPFVASALACALLAGAAHSAGATCDRDCLRDLVTQYLSAMLTHSPSSLPVSDHVRFTEDTVEMKLGASPLWQKASRLRPYRLDILDVRQGVAATQAVVEEAGAPVMLMLRLKLDGAKIAEVETQVTRSKAEGSIFNPDALKTMSGAMILFLDPAQRNSREEAIRIAALYPAGLKAGSFVTVGTPFAPDAYRFENGQLMAGPGCTFRPDCVDIKGQKIPTLSGITYRVAAVDEELGIVLLRMDFGAGSTRVAGDSLAVWEAFKVYSGQIHAVEAFMKNMPSGTHSGWDTPESK
jgi:hypothetical protein